MRTRGTCAQAHETDLLERGTLSVQLPASLEGFCGVWCGVCCGSGVVSGGVAHAESVESEDCETEGCPKEWCVLRL